MTFAAKSERVKKFQRPEKEPESIQKELEPVQTENTIDKSPPMSQEKWDEMMNNPYQNNISKETSDKLETLREAKQLQELTEQTLEHQDLWIPIDSLPSNNKVYNTEKTVFYRKYTFEDFEYASSNLLPQQRFKRMLEGLKCTQLESILLLPFYDFTAASFIRKIEAQGADKKYAIPYRCEKCGQIGTTKFTAKDIQFNALDIELPVKVRLHTFPDIIFEFMPHTIGDAIFLMDEDFYYAKNENGEYVLDVTGSPIVDRKSMLAVCCSNYSFREAYDLFQRIEYKEDYDILMEIAGKLQFGIKNVEFTCKLHNPDASTPLDEENQKKLDMIKDWKGQLPPIFEEFKKSQEICGQKISIDILGGDVLFLPFREHTDTTEYGILTS